jgi:hypothetical protein
LSDRFHALLGLGGLLLAGRKGDAKKRLPLVRSALRALSGDESFDDSVEVGKRYLNAARDLARSRPGDAPGGFRFVVFGHTHHRKKVDLAAEGATYLNTGTWANLMRFPADLLSDDKDKALASLESFFERVRTNDLDEYLDFVPTYVRLDVRDDGRVDDAHLKAYDWKAGKLALFMPPRPASASSA